MITLTQAIRQVYGVNLRAPNANGDIENFKIDRFRIGFVLSMGDVAIFGCRYDRRSYAWSPEGVFPSSMPTSSDIKKSRADKDLMERCVIECAKGLVKRGERLSAADKERLDRAIAYFAIPDAPPNREEDGRDEISRRDIERANSDIVSVVGKHVDLKKIGKNYSACCPFHNEKSPSFTVSYEKQFYYCFGCGASGDAIRFVTEYLGLGFRDAIHEINGIIR